MKCLGHPFLFLLPLPCYIGLFFLLQLIPLAAFGRYYHDVWLGWLQVAWVVGLMMAWVCLLLTDLVLQAVQCKIVWMDHYWFKMEFYVLTAVLVGYFCFVLGFGVLAAGPQNSVQYHLLWLYQIGFVLLLTICKTVWHCAKKKPASDNLRSLLENEETRILFEDFAHSEYSIENVLCYDSLQQYKKQEDQKKRRELAENIHHLYLNGASSELEINIPRSLVPHIAKLEVLSDDLYAAIEKTVLGNIADTYSRFEFSLPYVEWKRKRDNIKEALEGQ